MKRDIRIMCVSPLAFGKHLSVYKGIALGRRGGASYDTNKYLRSAALNFHVAVLNQDKWQCGEKMEN